MLAEVTVAAALSFILIFARIGTIIHFVPLFGDKYIIPKQRAAIAITLSFIIYPIALQQIPQAELPIAEYTRLLFGEILVGTLLGLSIKIIFLSLHTVGAIISMQSGLGMAMFFDLTQKEQTAVFTSFFFLTALMTILTTDTHYMFIQGAVESYTAFPPGKLPNYGDMSDFMTQVVNRSFVTAFKLSAPFLVVSTALLVGSGILARLMPNLQVFFVMTPIQVLASFMVLYIVISNLMEYLMKEIQNMALMNGII